MSGEIHHPIAVAIIRAAPIAIVVANVRGHIVAYIRSDTAAAAIRWLAILRQRAATVQHDAHIAAMIVDHNANRIRALHVARNRVYRRRRRRWRRL